MKSFLGGNGILVSHDTGKISKRRGRKSFLMDTVDMKLLAFPFFLNAEQRHSYLTCSMGICPISRIHHFGFRFHVECHVTSDVNKPRKFGHPLVTHAHTCTNFRPGILNSCC